MKLLIATQAKILVAAQRMTQALGYNGLSFRHLAKAVGIKSSSVHYHFASKALLGAAVARHYTDRLIDYLNQDTLLHGDLASAMTAYVAAFRRTLEQDGRMCLCGMLAAETDAIPEAVRQEVRRFVDVNVDWISLKFQQATGGPPDCAAGKDHARALFAALEGAMLMARGAGDVASFDTMVAQYRRTGLLPG